MIILSLGTTQFLEKNAPPLRMVPQRPIRCLDGSRWIIPGDDVEWWPGCGAASTRRPLVYFGGSDFCQAPIPSLTEALIAGRASRLPAGAAEWPHRARAGPRAVARIIRGGSLRSTHCTKRSNGVPGVEPREEGAYRGPVALPSATGDRYVDRLSGEPARLHAATAACRLVAAATVRLQQKRS